ncbi:MAG: hypothetical protein RBS96_07215 [Dehalococcoidales bacterium]|nr:hypothetical protein [Dehalococcoidales bacterium]
MLQIGDSYRLRTDGLNIILEAKKKRYKKDTKEPYDSWEIKGFYSSMESALKGMVDIDIKEHDLQDVKTIVARIDLLQTLIAGAIRSLRKPIEAHEINKQ